MEAWREVLRERALPACSETGLRRLAEQLRSGGEALCDGETVQTDAAGVMLACCPLAYALCEGNLHRRAYDVELALWVLADSMPDPSTDSRASLLRHCLQHWDQAHGGGDLEVDRCREEWLDEIERHLEARRP